MTRFDRASDRAKNERQKSVLLLEVAQGVCRRSSALMKKSACEKRRSREESNRARSLARRLLK